MQYKLKKPLKAFYFNDNDVMRVHNAIRFMQVFNAMPDTFHCDPVKVGDCSPLSYRLTSVANKTAPFDITLTGGHYITVIDGDVFLFEEHKFREIFVVCGTLYDYLGERYELRDDVTVTVPPGGFYFYSLRDVVRQTITRKPVAEPLHEEDLRSWVVLGKEDSHIYKPVGLTVVYAGEKGAISFHKSVFEALFEPIEENKKDEPDKMNRKETQPKTTFSEIALEQLVEKLQGKDSLSEYIVAAGENAIQKGFIHEDNPNGKAAAIALIHSEASEVLEAVRRGNPRSEKIPTHSNMEEELADIAIRLFDFCYQFKLDLEGAIQKKMLYNIKREHKHGKVI